MPNKHLNITYAYHFLSEAIILFLVAAPILYLEYRWVPYWSYLLVMIGSCLAFSLISKRTTNYGMYLLMVVPLFLAFFLFNYPYVVNIALSCLLTWRYMNIRKRSMVDLNRENGYIILTIILTTLGVIVIKDSELIIYASIQVISLIFGHIFSHLAVIRKQDRRQFDQKAIASILLPLVIGTIVFVPFFQSGKLILIELWAGFRYLVYILASSVGRIMQLFEHDRGWGDVANIEEGRPPSEGPYYQLNETESLIEIIAPYMIIGAGLVIAALIVILAVKVSKKVMKPIRQVEMPYVVSYSHPAEEAHHSENILSAFKKRFSRPRHPIRRDVFEFERKTAQWEKGRKPYETIEEWLKRIGVNGNLAIYQKVRYGEEDVTDGEARKLKMELKKMKDYLKGDV